ncbi:MoaD/ThiS family protein [Algoriphagus hitonicola]|uniref:Molybdopterin synthase sulfur carrier subunit n=1 Tax=Algoriphagus hitonicola TaxID=435880 RepID=A0A1I2VQI2_9BACT|nr:MoaD/ThiS family protein [Algoriphagus hitonicola]SFG91574.1 molybdopterin synthase sulfur carrier subunit [Algoriphagus hitonicola]
MENQISVKAFGLVAEKIGMNDFQMDNPGNPARFKQQLFERFPELKPLKFTLAINKKLAAEQTEIPQGAEVALLPPFSGG